MSHSLLWEAGPTVARCRTTATDVLVVLTGLDKAERVCTVLPHEFLPPSAVQLRAGQGRVDLIFNVAGLTPLIRPEPNAALADLSLSEEQIWTVAAQVIGAIQSIYERPDADPTRYLMLVHPALFYLTMTHGPVIVAPLAFCTLSSVLLSQLGDERRVRSKQPGLELELAMLGHVLYLLTHPRGEINDSCVFTISASNERLTNYSERLTEFIGALLAFTRDSPFAPDLEQPIGRRGTLQAKDLLTYPELMAAQTRINHLASHSRQGVAVRNNPGWLAVLEAVRMRDFEALLQHSPILTELYDTDTPDVVQVIAFLFEPQNVIDLFSYAVAHETSDTAVQGLVDIMYSTIGGRQLFRYIIQCDGLIDELLELLAGKILHRVLRMLVGRAIVDSRYVAEILLCFQKRPQAFLQIITHLGEPDGFALITEIFDAVADFGRGTRTLFAQLAIRCGLVKQLVTAICDPTASCPLTSRAANSAYIFSRLLISGTTELALGAIAECPALITFMIEAARTGNVIALRIASSPTVACIRYMILRSLSHSRRTKVVASGTSDTPPDVDDLLSGTLGLALSTVSLNSPRTGDYIPTYFDLSLVQIGTLAGICGRLVHHFVESGSFSTDFTFRSYLSILDPGEELGFSDPISLTPSFDISQPESQSGLPKLGDLTIRDSHFHILLELLSFFDALLSITASIRNHIYAITTKHSPVNEFNGGESLNGLISAPRHSLDISALAYTARATSGGPSSISLSSTCTSARAGELLHASVHTLAQCLLEGGAISQICLLYFAYPDMTVLHYRVSRILTPIFEFGTLNSALVQATLQRSGFYSAARRLLADVGHVLPRHEGNEGSLADTMSGLEDLVGRPVESVLSSSDGPSARHLVFASGSIHYLNLIRVLVRLAAGVTDQEYYSFKRQVISSTAPKAVPTSVRELLELRGSEEALLSAPLCAFILNNRPIKEVSAKYLDTAPETHRLFFREVCERADDSDSSSVLDVTDDDKLRGMLQRFECTADPARISTGRGCKCAPAGPDDEDESFIGTSDTLSLGPQFDNFVFDEESNSDVDSL
ncbi:hypothetical protein GMRT_12194 [Giardia muris]|uniref:Uncharacterized protein n=1 Tax=Giardia muris TaxID=5742 RepID=A0A4Z1SPP9_GIAMU|nr:hypothetical protein GMRT_12194 [Giardia muris]|eukprot:TNJ27802.1 hypothetical protein GMRT_12194 [Giardia muris]